MCDFLDLGCHAAEAAEKASKSFLDIIITSVTDSVGDMITRSVTAWVSVPSPEISSASETLRGWMLPFTVLIAVGGIMWQALQMIITRKSAPFAGVLKGLVTVTLWGGVAVVGSQLLLHFTDNYSTWVLGQGLGFSTADLDGDGTHDFTTDQSSVLTGRLTLLLSPAVLALGAPFVAFIGGLVVLICNLIQMVLLVFRGGAVTILAGMLQLAAAGSFTPATSGWLRKILCWQLSLLFYKPLAATVYAIAFRLIGAPDAGFITWLSGASMLAMSLVALPALMKFFNWPFGGSSGGGNAAAMAGSAAAAGMHAMASNRGAAGSATDYSRYLESSTPTPPPAARSSPSVPSGPAPTGGGAAGGLPVFLGNTTAVSSTTASSTTASASGAAAGTGAAAAAGGSAAGAATGATAAASAAGGPAGLAVGATVEVGRQIAQAGASAAKKAAEATTS